jgi:FAD:protein FMN transferase
MNFSIWGLSGSLTTQHPADLALAQQRLWHWIDAVDATCNRFRSDSEISRLNAHAGETVAISETLELALDAALTSSALTDGLCDPTVLPALLALGYDRDYDELVRRGAPSAASPVPAPGVGAIDLDRLRHQVTLAPGCQIDLGASAKALVVDRVADELAPRGGVVVEIGGDVAVRGASNDGPWVIAVSDSLAITGREPRVAIGDAGIATSSLSTRTWRAGDTLANHVIDPRTGSFAQGPYATATVSANTCVTANAFATAALLWGEDAGYYIAQSGWSARLVRHDGSVEFVGGWPPDGGEA